MKLNPRETALIIIDMQVDFCSPNGLSAQRGKGIEQITKLISSLNLFHKKMKQIGVVTIFTQMVINENSLINLSLQKKEKGVVKVCQEGTQGVEFYGINPEVDDIVIKKERYDSFSGTGLKNILSEKNIKNILITGVRADICVDATAKRAVAEDYDVFILEDLIATSDNRKTQQDIVLEVFGKYFGLIVLSTKAEEMLG